MGIKPTKIDTSSSEYDKLLKQLDDCEGLQKIFKIIHKAMNPTACIHNDNIYFSINYCVKCRQEFECDVVSKIDAAYILLSPRLYKQEEGHKVFLVRPLPNREISLADEIHIMNQEKIVDKIAQCINEYTENKLNVAFIEECMSSITKYIKEYEKSRRSVQDMRKLKLLINSNMDNTDDTNQPSSGIEGAPDAN